jgi:hypothetical protein
MISAQTSQRLQRALGRDWTKTVQELVEKRGHKTRNGSKFTRGYISMVCQGERHVPEVEEAIFEVYKETVQQIVEDARELGVPIPEPEQ